MCIHSSRLVSLVEHLDPVNVKIAELKEALESITAEQHYLKARDTRHRHSKYHNFDLRSEIALGSWLLVGPSWIFCV